MTTPNPSPPFRASPETIARAMGRRLRRLERGDVGLWHYVVDPSPPFGANKWGIPTAGNHLPTGGSIPPDAAIMEAGTGDVDSARFLPGWHNVPLPDGNYAPMAFRMHSATHLELHGAIGGGGFGTPAFTLPGWAWPRFTLVEPVVLADGSDQWAYRVSAIDGTVTLLQQVPSLGPTGGVSRLSLTFANGVTNLPIAGTNGSQQTVVASLPVLLDGKTMICVEFNSVVDIVGNGDIYVNIWQDGFDSGVLTAARANVNTAVVDYTATLTNRTYFTPVAGYHTYEAKAWSTAGSATLLTGTIGGFSTVGTTLYVGRA